MAGALALALAGGAAALYFGALREPEVVVQYVQVTQTEEAETVAAWLEKAEAAARGQRYVKPASDCALTYLLHAEAEHARSAARPRPKSQGRRAAAAHVRLHAGGRWPTSWPRRAWATWRR